MARADVVYVAVLFVALTGAVTRGSFVVGQTGTSSSGQSAPAESGGTSGQSAESGGTSGQSPSGTSGQSVDGSSGQSADGTSAQSSTPSTSTVTPSPRSRGTSTIVSERRGVVRRPQQRSLASFALLLALVIASLLIGYVRGRGRRGPPS